MDNNSFFSMDNGYESQNERNPNISSIYNKSIIVFFRKPSYNNTVTSQFEYYGGTIKNEWNNQFNSFSGFAGVMPLETNKTAFQNEFRDATIENDEVLGVSLESLKAVLRRVKAGSILIM